MSSGDMWWLSSNWSARLPPGVTMAGSPQGITFSGFVVQPPTYWFPGPEPSPPWYFQLTSHYFLDPSRMPAVGEPFIAMPRVTFGGGLALRGGLPGEEGGSASFRVKLRQSLLWDDENISTSFTEWVMGSVRGVRVVAGKDVLIPQKRDFEPLLFNIDRTRTLSIMLVTTLTWDAWWGGIIAFAPLVVDIPPWKVWSLD